MVITAAIGDGQMQPLLLVATVVYAE